MSDDLSHSAAEPSQFFRELDIQLLIHELKGPLALIESTTQTLLDQSSRLGPLTARQEKALKRIQRGSVRGRRLVMQLLEVGRAESAQLSASSFDPAAAVFQELLASVEVADAELAVRLADAASDDEKLAVLAGSGISLTIDPGVSQVPLFQDLVKFDLIVGNVLQNALHFRRKMLDVSLSRDADALVVSIRDDGPGIAPEHHAAVFERFKQVTNSDGPGRKGHGLGLAGARILAQRMGGDITLDSVLGHGAAFRLALPWSAPGS